MQVDDEGHADKPEWEPRKHEEVRQGVDLDKREARPAMGPADRPTGPDQKRQVLAQVCAKAGALVTLDVQSVDADPVDDAVGRIARPAQREDLHRSTAGHQRLGLAPDARIFLVVGMDDHAHGPRRRADRAGRAGAHVRTC